MPSKRQQYVNAQNQRRRDDLKARKLCINGEKHGAATRGTRCYACTASRRSPGYTPQPKLPPIHVTLTSGETFTIRPVRLP